MFVNQTELAAELCEWLQKYQWCCFHSLFLCTEHAGKEQLQSLSAGTHASPFGPFHSKRAKSMFLLSSVTPTSYPHTYTHQDVRKYSVHKRLFPEHPKHSQNPQWLRRYFLVPRGHTNSYTQTPCTTAGVPYTRSVRYHLQDPHVRCRATAHSRIQKRTHFWQEGGRFPHCSQRMRHHVMDYTDIRGKRHCSL